MEKAVIEFDPKCDVIIVLNTTKLNGNIYTSKEVDDEVKAKLNHLRQREQTSFTVKDFKLSHA